MALIETLTDSFADLSNWEVTGTDTLYTAAGGQVTGDVANMPLGMQTVGTYDFTGSWFSLECVDYSFNPAAPLVFTWSLEIYDSVGDAAYNQISVVAGYPSHGNVSIYDGTNLASIPDPGVPIVLGMRESAGICYAFYSTNSGVDWTFVGTTPTGGFTDPVKLRVTTTGPYGAESGFTVAADNLNLYEPPLADPTTTFVSVGHIAMAGRPVVEPSTKKFHEFSSTFSDMTGFFNAGLGTATAAGTLDFPIASGTPFGSIVAALGDTYPVFNYYSVSDSWWSVKILNYMDVPTNTTYNVYMLFAGNTDSVQNQYSLTQDGADLLIGFNATLLDTLVGFTGAITLAGRWSTDYSSIWHYYSLNDGATWTSMGSTSWNQGDNPFNTLYLWENLYSPDADFALSWDDFNVAEPPDDTDPTLVHVTEGIIAFSGIDVTLPDFDVPTSVDPGVIDLVGVTIGGISFTDLLSTFTDSFANLSNWSAFDTHSTTSAAGTLDMLHASGATAPSSAIVISNNRYNVANSWTSLKVKNMGDMPSNTLNSFDFQIQDYGVTNYYYAINLTYNTTTHLVTPTAEYYNGTITSVAGSTFSRTTGQEIVLGMRQIESQIAYLYSLDNGSHWTQFAEMPWSPPGGLSDMVVKIHSQVDAPSSSYTASFDDLSLIEPPDMYIISTGYGTGAFSGVALDAVTLAFSQPVDPGTITFSGITITGLIYGQPEQQVTPGTIVTGGVGLATVILGASPPVVTVDTPGEINLLGIGYNPIVGTYPIGDPFDGPIRIRESGSGSFSTGPYTLQTGEPATALTKSAWIEYTADAPMTVTLAASGSSSFILEVFYGDTLDTMTVEDSTGLASSASIEVPVNTGPTYFRLTTSSSFTAAISWSFVPSASGLMVDALTPVIDRAPDDLRVAVLGGDPAETLQFTWYPPVSSLIGSGVTRPIVLANITADSTGNIYVGTLPIPPVFAGTYTVNVKGLTSGRQGSVSFTVTNDPLPQDTGGTDVDPVPQTGTKWLWDDGLGHTWEMDINPDKMQTVVPMKVLTAEHTTGSGGRHVIWNGATPATDWGFSGTLLTTGEYAEMESFYQLNRKFYITTHRNKTYIVTFKSLDMVPHKNSGSNFWAHDYTASLYLFGEKV